LICLPITVYRTGGLAGDRGDSSSGFPLKNENAAGCGPDYIGTINSPSDPAVEVRWPLGSPGNFYNEVEATAVDRNGVIVFSSAANGGANSAAIITVSYGSCRPNAGCSIGFPCFCGGLGK